MSRGTILIVEDEPRLRFFLHVQLQAAGFAVIPQDTGDRALDTLKSVTPDLILVNILLPGIDGVQVCERVRADIRLARIPVIFLTAKKDPESRTRCFNAGANDYVTKPWDTSDLVRRICNAIALARNLPT